jgi:hypothetical protein
MTNYMVEIAQACGDPMRHSNNTGSITSRFRDEEAKSLHQHKTNSDVQLDLVRHAYQNIERAMAITATPNCTVEALEGMGLEGITDLDPMTGLAVGDMTGADVPGIPGIGGMRMPPITWAIPLEPIMLGVMTGTSPILIVFPETVTV